MARVTVEDCIEIVPDRFDLVLFAARRAKQIATGGDLTIERDNDKDSVVSLREIAGKTVDADSLEQDLIYSFSKRRFYEPKTQEENTEDTVNLPKNDMTTAPAFASEPMEELMDEDGELPSDEEPILASSGEESATGMAFGDDDVDVED